MLNLNIVTNPMPTREFCILVNSLAEMIATEFDYETQLGKLDNSNTQYQPRERLS